MRIALDTNILIRNANAGDRLHRNVAEAVRTLITAGAELVVAPQVLFEFWAVATRPTSSNGLELSPGSTRRHIDGLRTAFTLLPDPQDLVDRWLVLCERHQVIGRPAHDARLAAWMEAYNIHELLTLNPRDFARFEGVQCRPVS